MTYPKKSFKYALPRADDYLRLITDSIIWNSQNNSEAQFTVAPLVTRAYTLVYETGTIPYQDYAPDTEFLYED
jgi:hypothetical protein